MVLEQSFASTGVAPRAERRGGGASTNKKPVCGVVALLIGSAGEGNAAIDLLIERLKLAGGDARRSVCPAVTHAVVLSPPDAARLKSLTKSLAFKVTLPWLRDSLDQCRALSVDDYLPTGMQQAASRPGGGGGVDSGSGVGEGRAREAGSGSEVDEVARASKRRLVGDAAVMPLGPWPEDVSAAYFVCAGGLGDKGLVPKEPGMWWCDVGQRWEFPGSGIDPLPRLDAESAQDGLSTAWDLHLRRRAVALTGGKMSDVKTIAEQVRTLHPTPYTLHPTPLHPTPYTLHPTPHTYTPYTLHL